MFLIIAGLSSMQKISVDAIPDLSDTQVIVYSKWSVSPDIIEDQVTYPIVSSLLGVPKVKDIRGLSTFGFSYVYVIFEDGTDIYWARSRVLEYLSKITPQLPKGVKTELGPDATGVGWVYQYALKDTSGNNSLADLRSFQDWFLKYQLQSVSGVSEVASIGGFEKQYQVKINPNLLQFYRLSITDVMKAVRAGNLEIGARVFEISGAEYMVRGRGYIKNQTDLENIVVGASQSGTPIYLKNVSKVSIGPEMRRGIVDLDGMGDAVGGIVIMRFGENANTVIERVKSKIEDLKPSLPKGVEIVEVYNRKHLIDRAINTLTRELSIEMLVVGLIILIFLLNIPSSSMPILLLPTAVVISFIPMYLLGVSANIMSLGGIAISIGAMVDASIVVIENCHKKLEEWNLKGRVGDHKPVLIAAIKEVGPSSFYSLLVIAVSFLPIFTLEAQEGRLFKPLAYTKTLSMGVAAILAITLAPALLLIIIRFKKYNFRSQIVTRIANKFLLGSTHSEEKHPISKFLFKVYGPIVDWVVVNPLKVIGAAILALLITIPVFLQIGSEFMPPLNEGSILYMPTTMPGISVTEAEDLLRKQDEILKSFPEVKSVFGKAGKANTSTDPAPFSMMETTVILKDQREWRKKERWYSGLPEFLKGPFRALQPDFITWDELISEMDSKMKFPGLVNAWTMPIKARLDMLSTGIRTPVGIKVSGSSLKKIEQIGIELEKIIPRVKGTRSVFAERITGGYFLDFDIKREALARYGISVEEIQQVIKSSVGGMNVSTTIEGRERYSINVRYARDFRENLEDLNGITVKSKKGQFVRLGDLAKIELKSGPGMIRNDNGLLTGYVFVDVAGVDIGTYVKEAKKLVHDKLKIPPGYSLNWSGQYESMIRVREKLTVVVPITLLIIIFLIYLNTKSAVKTSIILLGIPFSAIGAFWLIYILGYNMSIAVWVGLIALLGIDAEMAIFMLLYLDLSYEKRVKEGRMNSLKDLKASIHEGAVKRIRPKVMTVATTFIALLPIMIASTADTGADVMKRMAAPMVGGIFSSFLLELIIYPAIYTLWRGKAFKKPKAQD